MSDIKTPMTPMGDNSGALNSDGSLHLKFLARVFGVMFIALAGTALSCFLFTWLFRSLYGEGEAISEQGYFILMCILGGSFIFLFIYSIIASFVTKNGKGIIPLFIVYVIVMGLAFSSFMVFTSTWAIMGEALAISAVAFLVMFAIGYFSKANLGWLGLVALGLLFGALAMSLFFGIWYLISPANFYWMDVVISAIVLVSVMILTSVSANRMKRTIASGGYPSTSLVLYFAFDMYVNFINILLRVFYLLLASKSNN